MINYLTGDATEPIEVEGRKVIAHIVNNQDAWGKGFALALGTKYPKAKNEYHRGIIIPNSHYQERRKLQLDDVQLVRINEELLIANMCAQNGLKSYMNPVPLNYVSLLNCLRKLRIICIITGIKSIHMPRIGSGLAGGNWFNISTMIDNVFETADIKVYVYDLAKGV